MSGPLDKTFATLTVSPASEAVSVLLTAVESTNTSIALAAAVALIDRQGVQGQREVLARFPQLPAPVQQALRTRAERFDGLLRQMLLHSPSEYCLEGLIAVRWLHAVDQIPRLIELLGQPDFSQLDSVEQCLRDLVRQLEDDLRAGSLTDSVRTAAVVRRDRALAYFEQAIRNFEALAVKDPVIECVLILAPPQHSAVKLVLWHAVPECRERAGRLLLTSRHPQVMRQVLESFRQTYPHPKAFEAIRTRTDIEFLCELFRFCTTKSNPALEQNLKQIEHLAWLEAEEPPWELIPPALQPALLAFVFSTKVPVEIKAKTQDWLLRNGGPDGRRAAAERAALADEHTLQTALVDSLNADDEHVQAWAVTQLRQHAVPETFSLLLERLDSPSEEVREAARRELSDFNLERVLGLIDELDSSTAIRVGELLRKVDPEASAKLERNLHGPFRPGRLRAAQAIVKLGFQDLLLPPLLSLADDGDFMLRRQVAELLAPILDPEVLPVLARLTKDSHPRVRESAVHALIAWQKHSAEQLDPLLSNTQS